MGGRVVHVAPGGLHRLVRSAVRRGPPIALPSPHTPSLRPGPPACHTSPQPPLSHPGPVPDPPPALTRPQHQPQPQPQPQSRTLTQADLGASGAPSALRVVGWEAAAAAPSGAAPSQAGG